MGRYIKSMLLICYLVAGIMSTAKAQEASVMSPYPNIDVNVIAGTIVKTTKYEVLVVDMIFENLTDEDVDIYIKKGMFCAYDDCGTKYESSGINVYYGNMVEMLVLGNNQFDLISCNPIKVRVEITNLHKLASEMKRIYFHFDILQWNIKTAGFKECIVIKDIQIKR